MPTTVTPSNSRKSGRKVRKPDRMDDSVITPNPVRVTVPLPASKSLPHTVDISTKGSKDSSSSENSNSDSKYHRSKNYSRFQLYQKWCVAKELTKDLQSENKGLLTKVAKLRKDLSLSDKTCDILRDTKRKLQASVESVVKLKSENQSLSDTVKSLNRDYRQLLESKANEKSHFDATLKLKEATLIQKHKCNVGELELLQKRKDLIEIANQEEIKRLKEMISSNQTKLKNYDMLASQAFKANLQMKTFENKAVVR